MFRLLFWIAMIAVAVWLWRRFNRPAAPAAKPQDDEQPAPMVRCAQCGVHVLRNKALPQDRLWYCSQAHLEQGQPRQ